MTPKRNLVESGVAALLRERGDVAGRAVAGLRDLSGPIAAGFYGQPSARLDLVAVTGTNGKTSTTHWIAQGLQSQGRSAAVIGTLGSGPLDALDPFGLTTPDALRLQRMLAGFVGLLITWRHRLRAEVVAGHGAGG